MVDYLRKNTKHDQGLDIAQRFINTVYCGYKKTGYFFEKYNADVLGGYGEGGEYVVQDGFGWTNSAVIKFMEWFGKELTTVSTCSSKVNHASFNDASLYTLFFSLICLILFYVS